MIKDMKFAMLEISSSLRLLMSLLFSGTCIGTQLTNSYAWLASNTVRHHCCSGIVNLNDKNNGVHF